MIELKKSTNNDLEFLKQFGFKGINDVYIIEHNKEDIGVIEFSYEFVDCEDSYYSICIEYIDILSEYRRKGVATSVVEMLSQEGLNPIRGNSLPNNIAVSFWKSVGADFGGEEEDLDHYAEFDECIGFSL